MGLSEKGLRIKKWPYFDQQNVMLSSEAQYTLDQW